MPKRFLFEELRVRTNPNYDHDAGPLGNATPFWDPTAVTHDLIKLANAGLEVTQEISKKAEARQRLRQARRPLVKRLGEIENFLLDAEKLSPTEAKTTRTVEAAIYARAKTSVYGPEYWATESQRDALDEQLSALEAELDVLHEWTKAMERMGEQLKTASFAQRQQGNRGAQY